VEWPTKNEHSCSRGQVVTQLRTELVPLDLGSVEVNGQERLGAAEKSHKKQEDDGATNGYQYTVEIKAAHSSATQRIHD